MNRRESLAVWYYLHRFYALTSNHYLSFDVLTVLGPNCDRTTIRGLADRTPKYDHPTVAQEACTLAVGFGQLCAERTGLKIDPLWCSAQHGNEGAAAIRRYVERVDCMAVSNVDDDRLAACERRDVKLLRARCDKALLRNELRGESGRGMCRGARGDSPPRNVTHEYLAVTAEGC